MITLPENFPTTPTVKPGEVWLVGAGPGDPRLLTIMAIKAIQTADAIIHDALIDTRVLDLAQKGAKIIYVGKRGGMASSSQPEITATLIELAQAGHAVVRLKGGDPFVFGRGGEEAEELAKAGIGFRIIPGITAGLAGPAMMGIPATTRKTNHAVILATGHRVKDDQDGENWRALARTGQPIILYMAMKRLEEIMLALADGGLDQNTPVAIISSATMKDEKVLRTTLKQAIHDVKQNAMPSPAIVVVGAIAAIKIDMLVKMSDLP